MCRKGGGYQWSVSAIALVVLILGIDDMAHGQFVRTCGAPSPLTPVSGASTFDVVPSMCVSERYDSNVFYRAPSPGLQRDDFVTNVNPKIRVNHNGDYASGFLKMGGFGESYVKNPGLNYIGTSDTLSLDLNNSIKRWLPNATLSVLDTFSYTPLPPGLVNPQAGTSPSAPANVQDELAQGFLAFRTNKVMNNGTVSTSYATTATTSLHAAYNVTIVRFGSSSSTGGPTLFDTTSQTGTVGGEARLTEIDTLKIYYSNTQTEFASRFRSSHFVVDSATIGWSRTLTPNISAEVGGGGILISPGLTTYAADAALIMNFLNNRATISYHRSAFPSFVGVGVPMVGDVFLLSAIQTLDQQWQLAEFASYSHRSGGSGINAVTFDSYGASVDIYYWMTRIWSTALSFDYIKFNSEFGSVTSDFDRKAITLSVRAIWG